MEYRRLGYTSIIASRLCFGTLTFSPLQKNLPIERSAELLEHAFSRGVNIIDTAELYNNYNSIAIALNNFGREKISVVTKSYAYDKKTAKASLDKAIKEMNCEYIDVFMLHEQESIHTMRGHSEAIDYFLEMKKKGVIKAFGISTHYIAGVNAAISSGIVDVLHPIFNKAGLGIVDGDIEQMYNAINTASENKMGIIGMKALGGGHLMKNAAEAMGFVLDCNFVDSVAVGMQSEEEIDYNVSFFQGKKNLEPLDIKTKKLFIHDWCTACGKCVKRCAQGALVLIDGKDGKTAQVNEEKCVLCGYCASVCEDFCIKVL